MSQAFYRKWRPAVWDQVVAQEHVITTLRNAVSNDRVAHAYLFAGPRGTGKTTAARLLAKAVNCLESDTSKRPCDQCENCKAFNQGTFLDLIEIDAASNTSVEDIRDLRDKINFSPNKGKYKVYIIDEVHMLSTAAFNALLKTLEEPPAHAIFILATTEIHKIPATVLSRCQRHEFRMIPLRDMEDYLEMKTKEEGIKIEKDAIDLVAKQATGALRDALSLLDLLASTGEKITLEKAQRILGISADRTVIELLSAVVDKDAQKALDAIHTSLGSGSDSRQFARQVVDVLRQTLFIKTGNAEYVILSKEDKEILSGLAQKMEIPQLLYLIEVFNQTAEEKQITWQPSLALEIAIIKAINPTIVQPTSAPPSAGAGNVHTTTSVATSNVQPVKKKTTKSKKAAPAKKDLPQWNELLTEARKLNKNLEALLKTSSKRFVENDALWLGYSSNMIIKKFDEGTNLKDLKEVIKNVFGKEYQINCFETSLTEELPDGIKQDSLVANAIRLGGEIVSENDLN